MRKFITLPLVLLMTIILASTCMVLALFSRRKGPTRVMRWWGKAVLWFYGVRLEVSGLENLEPDRPAIYMSNHASMIDIPVLIAALPLHIRFVYKKSLSYVPFVGQAILLMGMIPIDRANRERAIKSLRKAGQQIKKGVDLLIFPEGTRSRSGELLPFKKGGFLLAIQESIDIVPVSLSFSQKLAGRNALWSKPGYIEVAIHPRVIVEQYNLTDRSDLMSQVRREICSGIRI